jgi:5-methylcytosine-specific restriction endonuclease McrA
LARGKRQRILAIVATDRTFAPTEWRGVPAWAGKCLHCNAHLLIGLDGEPISRATIEHIVPRTHGGTDELTNLGLACARCNLQKGHRHDVRGKHDARAREVVERLLERRRERWREP